MPDPRVVDERPAMALVRHCGLQEVVRCQPELLEVLGGEVAAVGVRASGGAGAPHRYHRGATTGNVQRKHMRTAAAAALVLIALSGCSSSAPTTSAPAPTSATPSYTWTEPVQVPDETAVAEATVDTTPTPDLVVNPYTFTCTDVDETEYQSLAEVWKSDSSAYDCTASTTPGYTRTDTEAAVAAAYIKADLYFGEGGETGALEDLMGMCAEKGAEAETLLQDKDAVPYALKLCPKAPQAKLMKLVADRDVFVDGTYEIGSEVKPGTYRTAKKMTDCYWERSTKGGDIIANNFVGNAPAGVTVRIRSTDGGFKSDNCGTWTRVK